MRIAQWKRSYRECHYGKMMRDHDVLVFDKIMSCWLAVTDMAQAAAGAIIDPKYEHSPDAMTLWR